MARTKPNPRPFQPKPLITWTRFYLPRDQEWPVWPATADGDVHAGPFYDVGCRARRVGRKIDDPEQAAYIVEWFTREDLRTFQASPACVEFLRNLPERKEDAVTGSRHAQLTLDDGSGSGGDGLPPRAITSRFLLCKHSTEAATRELNDIVTITALSVPRPDAAADVDNIATWNLLAPLVEAFDGFMPPTPPGVPFYYSSVARFNAIWLVVLEEDPWAEEALPTVATELRETRAENNRVIFFHVFRWSECCWKPEEQEAASAADPTAKEAWREMVARVMPPATRCVQERWDIWDVPLWDPAVSDRSDWELDEGGEEDDAE